MKLYNGLCKGLLGVAAVILLSGQVQANTPDTMLDTKAMNAAPSVLPIGARIVAGDLSKNEFFIVGKPDAQPVNMIVTKHTRIIASKSDSQRIRAAVKRMHVIVSKKEISKIKYALNRPAHRLYGKKHGLRVHTALKKNKYHHIAVRKKISKVKIALK